MIGAAGRLTGKVRKNKLLPVITPEFNPMGLPAFRLNHAIRISKLN
jgi:hypothetical protein